MHPLQTSVLNLVKCTGPSLLENAEIQKLETLRRFQRESLNFNTPPQRLLSFNIDLAIIPSCLLKSSNFIMFRPLVNKSAT